MSRVVMGPYRAGIRLRDLFRTFADPSAENRDKVPYVQDFHSIDSEALHSSVFLTEDWAGRQNSWDWENTKLILATENEMKEEENDRPLRHTVLELVSKKSFIYGPDSLEEEETSIEIARMKAITGVLNPVKDATPKELSAALESIGVSDARHVVYMAEDRELIMDGIIREASVWDTYRSLPLVEECFEPDAAWPGKRINELVNACGGTINFLLLLDEAKKEMREKGHKVEDYSKNYVTYYMRFLEYDPGQPFPEEGIFITASEHNRKFRPVTEADKLRELAGEQMDLDEFDMPPEVQGLVDRNDRPITISYIRGDPRSSYFDVSFYAARAMRAFERVMKIPEASQPRTHKLEDMPGARLISNLNFGEFAQKLPEKIGDHRRVRARYRINSHEDFENAFLDADGTVIEDWPKEVSAGVNQTYYTLERKLVTRMVIANRATLKPLAAANAVGRPIMVNTDVQSREMGAYFNAEKFRTVTARQFHVFGTFSDQDSFSSVMAQGQWDKRRMKPIPDKHEYDLFDEESMFYMLGGRERGFTEALVGSASSHIQSGNDDALHYVKQSAKKTITMIHGGASRYIMGKLYQGAIDMFKEGYRNFISLGVRVPLVSRKEGSLKPLLRENKLSVQHGSLDGDYISFCDGCCHAYTADFIGERQHIILGPADVVTAFIGGSGTEYEYDMAMYHNLMVEMRGYGIFPGFDNNDRKIRIHLVNSPVMNGGNVKIGYYDRLKESYTQEEHEILNMHFYDTCDEALEARNSYAAELGYDLDAPRDEVPARPRYESLREQLDL